MDDELIKNPMFITGVLVLSLWTLFWKGLSLWHAAKKSDKWWYIALLVINSAGILDMVYLFYVCKLKSRDLFK